MAANRFVGGFGDHRRRRGHRELFAPTRNAGGHHCDHYWRFTAAYDHTSAPSANNSAVDDQRDRSAAPRASGVASHQHLERYGEDDVELNSIAEQAACAGCRVQGRLSVTTTVEHQLQDIVTANLRLSLTITQPDGLVRSFTLTSRGGGFTRDVAIDQALERMAASLTKSLRAAQ
ncbi:MAG TPA: hypothetical protein VN380_02700 [Thermoanaerobaculia bacterium]|jgi:hypothetical protein|nr:hypothetical protein [Thermoanaerobaculia bacterium]